MQKKPITLDTERAIELLLDIAHETTIDSLLRKFIQGVLKNDDIAWMQIWLKEKEGKQLYLAAGGGRWLSSGSKINFDSTSHKIPLGEGFIGKLAVDGNQGFLTPIGKESELTKEFVWLGREKIRTCGAAPINFKGETLGVLIGFSRFELSEESKPWSKIFADRIGASLANAQAFEEIQRLKSQLELQNSYLQEEVVEAKAFGSLVGESEALHQIVKQIDLVAPTEASVLIIGETGTGKELVAHEIYRRSARKDKPFVRVNCAAIPRDLYESEFFGHAKGAFTGAVKDRAGRFETADGGTIFLDEIGEVPLDLQSKLLRVLQEKHYERVGEDKTRKADVRIIAATNKDLKKEVAAGRFREDLYYRLNIFPIQAPSLRERRKDIPMLAKHFIDLSVKEMRCPVPRLTKDAITRLCNYDWPGNVRELRNVIERSVILARGGPLYFDLPNQTVLTKPLPAIRTDTANFLTEAQLQQRERENLLTILNEAKWKIKGSNGAAELLGVKPTTMIARIKKMGLKRPSFS